MPNEVQVTGDFALLIGLILSNTIFFFQETTTGINSTPVTIKRKIRSSGIYMDILELFV